jgi:hypothetical protein
MFMAMALMRRGVKWVVRIPVPEWASRASRGYREGLRRRRRLGLLMRRETQEQVSSRQQERRGGRGGERRVPARVSEREWLQGGNAGHIVDPIGTR